MERQLLEKAIRIAVNAHAGQMDKAGFPYILHPLRVMHSVKTLRQKIVAILHDVIEDTSVTAAELLDEGLTQDLVDLVLLVTKKHGENYDDYLNKIKEDEDARAVKLADMKDNSNILRYHELEEKHLKMAMKYHKGIKALDPNHTERLEI